LGEVLEARDEAAAARRRTRRSLVGSYALVIFFLVTLNFFLPRALPGKPIAALSDPRSATYVGDQATRDKVERYYGLDRPLLEQYGSYLSGLAQGDLGMSIRYQAPVTEVVGARLPWTLLLVGGALMLATGVGVAAGVHSGWRRGLAADRGLLAVFLAIDNFPIFFLGSVAAYLFAVKLGWSRCRARGRPSPATPACPGRSTSPTTSCFPLPRWRCSSPPSSTWSCGPAWSASWDRTTWCWGRPRASTSAC
jgi:ABC-type dipeptide/oligopeptide/nickel transport system permease component